MADRFDLINFSKSVTTTLGGVTANVNIDANTLFIDGTNNRVGVGTNAPTAALQVAGDIVSSGTIVPASSYLRNRIINGDMRIDQRNAGASSTAINVYTVDRWIFGATQSSRATWQQNAASVTPPPGFTNYLGVTSSSAYTIVASDSFRIIQRIEGFNTADLGWGTAGAQAITLSFWVRSSLTGTFGGYLTNSAGNRFYVFSYTINAANTWELKAVNIVGDTTGTWLTNNGVGIDLGFSIGQGSTLTGTAGSWGATTFLGPTGQTNVLGTNGATFYLTGVQLEVGSVATPFERRQFGQELQLCQRYFSESSNGYFPNNVAMIQHFKVTMRIAPTVTWAGSGGTISGIGTDSFSGFSSTNQTARWTASAEF